MEKIKGAYNRIDKTLLRFRNLALVISICSLLIALVLGILIVSVSNNNMLLIDKDGDIASAVKINENDYFFIEADNHVRLFYGRFFTYNRDNYKQQIELGLNLCGSSAKRLYETFKEKGWFDAVVNNDYTIESIVLGDVQFQQVSANSILFLAEGIQTISKDGLKQIRKLNIKGKIVKDQRIKIKNPHGLKITDLVIVNNDLKE